MRMTVQEWNSPIIEPLLEYWEPSGFFAWGNGDGWAIGYRQDGSVGILTPELKEPGDRLTKRDVMNTQFMIYAHQGIISGDDDVPNSDRWIRPDRLTVQLKEQLGEKLNDRKLIRSGMENRTPQIINGSPSWVYGADVLGFFNANPHAADYSFWSAGALLTITNYDTGISTVQGFGTGFTVVGGVPQGVTAASHVSFGSGSSETGGNALTQIRQATVAMSNSDFGTFDGSSIATVNFFSQDPLVPLATPSFTYEEELAAPIFSNDFPQLVGIPYRDDP